MPSPRKDLMLLVRRSEDAEGEMRMIGSIRFAEPALAADGFERLETRAGLCEGAAEGIGAMAPVALLRRPTNTSAVFRTCEKSWKQC